MDVKLRAFGFHVELSPRGAKSLLTERCVYDSETKGELSVVDPEDYRFTEVLENTAKDHGLSTQQRWLMSTTMASAPALTSHESQ